MFLKDIFEEKKSQQIVTGGKVNRKENEAFPDFNDVSSTVSEYKIGHTTYTVETHFNTGGENLSAIIQRLIAREAEHGVA